MAREVDGTEAPAAGGTARPVKSRSRAAAAAFPEEAMGFLTDFAFLKTGD